MKQLFVFGLLLLSLPFAGYGQFIDACPPVANDDSKTTPANTPVTVNVVSNDADCPADALLGGAVDPATVDLNTSVAGIQSLFGAPQGSYSVNGSGVVTFTPAQNYSGTATTGYTVNDKAGKTSNVATITVSVIAANNPPVADAGSDKTISLPANSVQLFGSGSDTDGSIAGYSWMQLSGPNSATLTNANTPTVTASGLIQGTYTFQLTVTDNQGATGTDQVIVTVNGASANKPPVANNDDTSTGKNIPVSINVVANDTDSDGTVNPATVDLNLSANGIQNSNNTSQGNFTVNGSGVVTFTPAADYVGAATLSYTVNDNAGAISNAAIITINVYETSNNNPPVAKNDSTRTSKNTPVTINVVANDTDFDGTVNPATVDLNTSLTGVQNINNTPQGNFTVNTSGVVTFVPALNYAGLVVINYTVKDNNGATSNAATISITVEGSPVAYNDLDIPTGFTPNGDGANETWKILPRHGKELNQFQNAEIRIYNKNGLLLYETKGFENRWDGKQNGEVLPADTYYYTIDLKIEAIRYKGIVTILR